MPILAAIGVGSIVTFLIIAAYVLSWLSNIIQSNNPKGPKPKNRPRPNGGQSELERFLQEVAKKNSGESARPANAKPKPPEKKKQKPPAPQPQAQRPSAPLRPGARLAESRLATSALGEGVRSHVASHMETRNVDNQAQKDIAGGVRRDIDDRVQRDMGSDATAIAMQRTEVVHPLMAALRSPQGVRQAVLLTEILNRPKSLRNH